MIDQSSRAKITENKTNKDAKRWNELMPRSPPKYLS